MSLIVDRFSLWMTAQLDYCGAVAAAGLRSAGGPNFPIVARTTRPGRDPLADESDVEPGALPPRTPLRLPYHAGLLGVGQPGNGVRFGAIQSDVRSTQTIFLIGGNWL